MFATQAVQFGGCGLVMHSKRKKDGKISRTMNDADHLNRIRLPDADHHIRVEVSKAIVPIEWRVSLILCSLRIPQYLPHQNTSGFEIAQAGLHGGSYENDADFFALATH